VRALAKRRKFDAAYKLAVLAEADRLTGAGEIGAPPAAKRCKISS